jgi:hypothetical protein
LMACWLYLFTIARRLNTVLRPPMTLHYLADLLL